MNEWMNEQGQNDELSEWNGVRMQKWMNKMIKNDIENEQLKMKNCNNGRIYLISLSYFYLYFVYRNVCL